jgi:nucleoside-diphosphate-sugar epimerase
MRILSIGGSGFVSGTLAQRALQQGHEIQVVTRGQRPLPGGVEGITADRKDRGAFAEAIANTPGEWDLVVDCIGFDPEDAEQDVACFRDRAKHLAFISTDFVFDPAHRVFPQREETEHYATEGYGGKKRACEQILESADLGHTQWTVVRPCHIYGPGSKLGCLPHHGRDDQIIDRIRQGETLKLVGGGYFLQQPILARDLSDLILSCAGNDATYGQIFCAAGPDIIESRTYYDEIARCLNVAPAPIEELDVQAHLAEKPGAAPFMCHRIYSLDRLVASGATAPSTPFTSGIKEHVESLA